MSDLLQADLEPGCKSIMTGWQQIGKPLFEQPKSVSFLWGIKAASPGG
jgi:hypothetical protein